MRITANLMRRQDLALEQKVLRGFKSLSTPPRSILLAISGGVDSVVMAEILYRWRRGLGLRLAVAHVHHGSAATQGQSRFRDRAQRLVQRWAQERKLEFFTNQEQPPRRLKNEQEWREWRERWLKEWRAGFDAVAFAHHQDDLLETRLIRLIRGSGRQGLPAMSVYRPGRWRPLLRSSREEIRAYADVRELTWVEDPSNRQTQALRNWMRREWLPALERKRPGAAQAVARSLEILAATLPSSPSDPANGEVGLAPYVGLRRDALVGCPVSQRRELIARYLHSLGRKGYAQTHVNEILKRLETGKGDSEFVMLGIVFKISHDFLWASRVCDQTRNVIV
jgi:tRNA(Ile)-lysidine synthase